MLAPEVEDGLVMVGYERQLGSVGNSDYYLTAIVASGKTKLKVELPVRCRWGETTDERLRVARRNLFVLQKCMF